MCALFIFQHIDCCTVVIDVLVYTHCTDISSFMTIEEINCKDEGSNKMCTGTWYVHMYNSIPWYMYLLATILLYISGCHVLYHQSSITKYHLHDEECCRRLPSL